MTDYSICEVLPGVFRVPVPLEGSPLKELNSYIFKKSKEPGSRNMVVDTGYYQDSCMNALKEAYRVLDIDPDETDFLLTHLHSDHVSCLPYLISEGCRAYMGSIDIDKMFMDGTGIPYSGTFSYSLNRMKEYGVPDGKLQEMKAGLDVDIFTYDRFYRDFVPVHEGDCLNAGAYILKAIHTPGHTPGHMVYLIEGTGAMLLGDTLLFDITSNIVPWVGVRDSLGDYLESLRKIDSYEITLPLPGHRHSGEYHRRISGLIEHHSKRIGECYAAVEDLGDAYLYDIAGHIQWKIRARNWDEFPPIQRWFALGECLAHLDHLRCTGRIKESVDNAGIRYFRAEMQSG